MIRTWPVPLDSGPHSCIMIIFFLLELMLLWRTGCQHSEHSPVTAWSGPLTAPLTPSFALRSEESALQASGRRAEERQEALWRSEPATNKQRRSGHVTEEEEEEGPAHVIGSGAERWKVQQRERREVWRWKVKWRTTSAAAIEMNMYIYYIRIHVIPCLWCNSFPLRRTETCLGQNLSVWKVDLQTWDKPSAWISPAGWGHAGYSPL